MPQDRELLSGLTLRQLRFEASKLDIPLYGRKSKAELINEIQLYEQRQQADQNLVSGSEEVDLDQNSSSTVLTRVVFLPRDPEWAYVFWEISEKDRNLAQSKGANSLCIRLFDVTDSSTGDLNPGTLREVVVDSHSTEWYLPIPMGDRDYRVELGYRFSSKWISLAISSIARVPAMHPTDQILDQFVPFSLEGNPITLSPETPVLVDSKDRDTNLHERLYQTATTSFRKRRVGSEEFQERGFIGKSSPNINDSGSGIWASGLNDSGIGGISPKERSFWLIADAELIVYGATDPSAKLTIGGEDIPLASDGTFKLQVPFRDGVQDYVIEASDASSEQTRNITMRFERHTPVDNTNPIDKSKSEWF